MMREGKSHADMRGELRGVVARAEQPNRRQLHVERLRRADPEAGPAVVVTKLEKRYLAAVTAIGAAVGSTAVLPGLGTLAALSAAAGETAVF